MDFTVDKEKAIEALVYIATALPGVDRFHACKILYFAERDHLRSFGRPIIGDRYHAMANGPVPSFAYDVLKGELNPSDRDLVDGALVSVDRHHHPSYEAGRKPRLEFFSVSDRRCLDRAIAYCAERSFAAISDETHQHKAWSNASVNAPMNWADFLDGIDAITVEESKVFAAYGVL